MVSSFKEKFKTKTSKAQNKCIRFCLNLLGRSLINLSQFRKIKWFLVSDRVEYCIVNTVFKYWNIIVPGYIHEMFKPSRSRYSTRSQMALDISLQKTNTGKKAYPSYYPKSALVSKMLEHRLLLCMLLRKIFYFIFKTNSSYYHLMIDIII